MDQLGAKLFELWLMVSNEGKKFISHGHIYCATPLSTYYGIAYVFRYVLLKGEGSSRMRTLSTLCYHPSMLPIVR